ncbi:alpha/beta hydrolase family esterase [Paracoccus sp. (in: a-proteobacteria)]|uniref:extracellular catalytic domain type 1 short-chain-length polyhydroxyalkanoate depolymerase n=1 Tax=Paracoccus sp. TaxID=267 RepID=UPI00396C759D
MTKPMQLNMAEVTRLMRAGQLSEATQMIQSQMGTSAPAGLGTQTSLSSMPSLQGLRNLPDLGSLPGLKGLQGLQGLPGQASVPVDVPEGAQWDWKTHQAAGLSREYRLYVPASLADGADPAGLILLLHGCTQDPDDFARGTGILEAAEKHRVIVVAPAQPSQANMNRCWNWFEPRHTAEQGGEAAFLTDLTRKVAHDHAIPPDCRFAMGLSAGGAMSVILGSVFPEDFGAVGCHSGLPNGAASDMGSAFAAMSRGGSDQGKGVGCRLFVLHGSADRTVTPANAQAVLQQSLREQPGLQRRAAAAKLEGRNVQVTRYRDADATLRIESWLVDGLGHAWSGGASQGSHTAPGPSATEAMMRFFLMPGRAA